MHKRFSVDEVVSAYEALLMSAANGSSRRRLHQAPAVVHAVRPHNRPEGQTRAAVGALRKRRATRRTVVVTSPCLSPAVAQFSLEGMEAKAVTRRRSVLARLAPHPKFLAGGWVALLVVTLMCASDYRFSGGRDQTDALAGQADARAFVVVGIFGLAAVYLLFAVAGRPPVGDSRPR